MTYTYTANYGDGVILAPCLAALCEEIKQRLPDAINEGEIGNAAHQVEALRSDHNPFITHGDKHYIRAIDVGGTDAELRVLADRFAALYAAKDPRVYPYGYTHWNNRVTVWFGHGETKHDDGDVGHLHISVTQHDGNNPSPSGWVAALDSSKPWGLLAPTPTPEDDMAWTDAEWAKLGQIVHDKNVAVNLRSAEVKAMIEAQVREATAQLAADIKAIKAKLGIT